MQDDKDYIKYVEHLLEKNGPDFQISVLKASLEKIADGLLELFISWRHDVCHSSDVSEGDAIAQCILQIVALKVKTLLSMSEGVSVCNSKIVDIPSMESVLRSLYELTFIFHNIFAEQKTLEEREIVLSIWEIRGLNNRQGLTCVPPEFVEQMRNEYKEIVELKNRVLELATKLNLSEELKRQLTNVLNSRGTEIKGYKFVKNDSVITGFEDIRFHDGSDTLFNRQGIDIYRFLSTHGHPSYLGVLQFGQMYNTKEYKGFLITILTITLILANKIITDFRDNINGGIEAFEKINQDIKTYILKLHL